MHLSCWLKRLTMGTSVNPRKRQHELTAEAFTLVGADGVCSRPSMHGEELQGRWDEQSSNQKPMQFKSCNTKSMQRRGGCRARCIRQSPNVREDCSSGRIPIALPVRCSKSPGAQAGQHERCVHGTAAATNRRPRRNQYTSHLTAMVHMQNAEDA